MDRPPPPTPAFVLSLALALPAAALAALAPAPAAACTLRGSLGASRVQVSPSGAPAFELRVENVAAEVSLDPGGQMGLRVTAPFLFDARLLDAHGAPVGVVARLRARTVAAQGRVTLPRATAFREVLPQAGDAGVTVTADLGNAVVRGVPLGCNALEPGAPEGLPGARAARASGPGFVPREGATLQLCAGPGRCGDAPTVEFPHGPLVFRRTARRGAWGRFEWHQAGSGAALAGWVPLADMQPEPSGAFAAITGVLATLPAARYAHVAPEVPPGVYVREARVRAGAAVFAVPGEGDAGAPSGQWATAVEGSRVTVRFAPGDRWARVISAPGLDEGALDQGCPYDLCHAWVAMDALQISERP